MVLLLSGLGSLALLGCTRGGCGGAAISPEDIPLDAYPADARLAMIDATETRLSPAGVPGRCPLYLWVGGFPALTPRRPTLVVEYTEGPPDLFPLKPLGIGSSQRHTLHCPQDAVVKALVLDTRTIDWSSCGEQGCPSPRGQLKWRDPGPPNPRDMAMEGFSGLPLATAESLPPSEPLYRLRLALPRPPPISPPFAAP